ncbi:MAG TPA: signal recognition particle protein Srp19 [Thermoprotei archaeon]|nr:signal recognition particle protein Srp19 [Thermoprotei archaeon]
MKEIRIWTAYFDASKTRRYGRRIRSDLAVRRPTQQDLLEAAKRLGLSATAEEARYPRDSWETGRVKISWEGKKQTLIKRIGQELRKIKQEPAKVSEREKS